MGDLVEIPRFKKRELNLEMVAAGRGWSQRLAWAGLWGFWVMGGLGGLVSCDRAVSCFELATLPICGTLASDPSIMAQK